MAKRRSKPLSPFLGRWHIVSMTEWDEDYIHEEVPAFIEFGEHQEGSFQFAYVRGEIDYRITTRRGDKPPARGAAGHSGTDLDGRDASDINRIGRPAPTETANPGSTCLLDVPFHEGAGVEVTPIIAEA
ncbi:MAG: hypothetical protein ACLQU5_24295 [Isosphaeraceae bacterium]